MWKGTFILVYALMFSMIFALPACKHRSSRLEIVKPLNNYPSGSAIAYANDKIYLMGDDAAYMLVMDTALVVKDTINFFISDAKRIPKAIKADPEAAAIVWENRKQKLLLLSSGSLTPQRNNAFIIDPATKKKNVVSLDTFYNRLKKAGIRKLNIEGLAGLQGTIIISNRGNKSYPRNQLIFTIPEFWKDQANAPISIANIGVQPDTASFMGVSGLEYSRKSDKLIVTLTTENTYSAHSDGEIGKSYLWIINDINAKKKYAGINPATIIDLEEIDARFKGRKIESVCILSEGRHSMELLLVSDDDKGGSELFKLHLEL